MNMMYVQVKILIQVLDYHYKATKNILSRLGNVPYTFELIKKDEIKKQGLFVVLGKV